MLVDSHAHLGLSATTAALTAYAEQGGVDAVLISNCAANVDEADANRACLDACQRHARWQPIYRVRLGKPDSNLSVLRGALLSEPFVGVLFAATESDFEPAVPLLGPYLELLASVGRTAVFCLGRGAPAAPAKIYDEARRQRLPIVLCACGGPDQRAAALDVARQALRSKDADVYVDTSHATADEVVAAVDALGAERVLFGSDAPSYGADHGQRVAALLAALRTELDGDEFQQITGENAERLFRLAGAAR